MDNIKNDITRELHKQLRELTTKTCKKCGGTYKIGQKICPHCSHTLEGVIKKYQIQDRKTGTKLNIQFILLNIGVLFVGLFFMFFTVGLLYLFGIFGLCLGFGIGTFFGCYMIFNIVKPVVKEIKHANDYITKIKIK